MQDRATRVATLGCISMHVEQAGGTSLREQAQGYPCWWLSACTVHLERWLWHFPFARGFEGAPRRVARWETTR